MTTKESDHHEFLTFLRCKIQYYNEEITTLKYSIEVYNELLDIYAIHYSIQEQKTILLQRIKNIKKLLDDGDDIFVTNCDNMYTILDNIDKQPNRDPGSVNTQYMGTTNITKQRDECVKQLQTEYDKLRQARNIEREYMI
jgi:NDP-sugar pyrophosphorylase family protein